MSSPESERLKVAARLQETGLALQRQNIRRRRPELSDQEVEVALAAWLADRPVDHAST